MKTARFAALALCASLTLPTLAWATATVGQPAPAFTAVDTAGKPHKLADYQGKYVVLEWVNPNCPFVRKHYNTGNMQGTQREAVTGGAVWLAVNSTSQNQRDYLSPADMGKWMTDQKAAAGATLMDTDGKLGNTYGAKTTPHMYIIDPQGKLIYAGAIDSKPTGRADDITGATNYVKQALGEARVGKPISNSATRPYGCSVKY